MSKRIKKVPVRYVEADEIWGIRRHEEITRLHKQVTDQFVGDPYTFVGIERNTKLVLGVASWGS